MSIRRTILRLAALSALLVSATRVAHADELRNVKKGEPLPAFKLPTGDGTALDSATMKGSVTVIVCLAAEQRRSELAAMESSEVVRAMGDETVRLVHITADVVQKPYFEKFRQDRGITAPLALDPDRAYFGSLGLIVFPTTIITNKDGRLAHVISLHGNEYKSSLDACIRHAKGTLSDKELEDRLAARPMEEGTPKATASAHRALARLMREKGQLDSARTELIKGRELDPDNRELMLDLADLDAATGNLDDADTMTDKVLAAQPEHRRARQLKGIILFRRGKLDEARSTLEGSLSLNPNPELVHYYLGRICEKQGQKDRAMEHYREALKRYVHDADEPNGARPQPEQAKP